MLEQELTIAPAPRPRQRQYTVEQRAAILKARKKRKAIRRRNQIIFLAICAVLLVLLLFGIVKLSIFAFGKLKAVEWPSLPAISAQAEEVTVYDAVTYDLSGYVYDADDPRLILVNANILLDENYTVETAVADDATGVSLETEAAISYRAMASAASADGITLVLDAGYHDAETQQTRFDVWQMYYLDAGYDEDEAYALAQEIVSEPYASEHLTGYGADILSEDYGTSDLGYADTAAFAWLSRYAAEYGFILRYAEDKEMITGRTYEPWHWRYVGVDNAKAIVQSGLSLEEFIEAGGAVD